MVRSFATKVGRTQLRRNFGQLNRNVRRSGLKKQIKDAVPNGLEESKVMLEAKLGVGRTIQRKLRAEDRLSRSYGDGIWVKKSHDNGMPGSGKKNRKKGISGKRVEVHYFYNETYRYGVEYKFKVRYGKNRWFHIWYVG